jgi:hypothetical protein
MWGEKIVQKENGKQELKSKIHFLEKEILYLTGRKRAETKMEYLCLLKSFGKEFGLEEPIYIMRC